MKLEGTIIGKEVYTYDPNIVCTEIIIKDFLSKFNLLDMLSKIAELSSLSYHSDNPVELKGVPILEHILVELAIKTIKYQTKIQII